MGFDNTSVAQSEFASLSSIDDARGQLGESTLSLLLKRIADNTTPIQHQKPDPQLIPRRTTAQLRH